jgi:hypothetical protein
MNPVESQAVIEELSAKKRGPGRRPVFTPEQRKRGLELFAEGLTCEQVAKAVGVSRSTADEWKCSPAEVARKRRNQAIARAERRKARARERARANAQSIHDALGESYALMRRLAQMIDRAAIAENDPTARGCLRSAQTAMISVEERLGEALQTSSRKRG